MQFLGVLWLRCFTACFAFGTGYRTDFCLALVVSRFVAQVCCFELIVFVLLVVNSVDFAFLFSFVLICLVVCSWVVCLFVCVFLVVIACYVICCG